MTEHWKPKTTEEVEKEINKLYEFMEADEKNADEYPSSQASFNLQSCRRINLCNICSQQGAHKFDAEKDKVSTHFITILDKLNFDDVRQFGICDKCFIEMMKKLNIY